ncbi:MAG: RIP metalloprotease RseP [Gammaproteobacteria bacterium RIFCSPHIGHO2_12_FULL_40_19]|nr:MAG: RIP metalloprotease RseP [Gammaproteobacteria bacterium RIFCSPHIGHO2_12_FULL_40_19]
MSPLIALIGSIFAFFIVVVIHEYGHFIVARFVGIKVLRFSIGFGKPIFKYRAKSGVEYVVGFLPFGGYVKMQDAMSAQDPSQSHLGSAGDPFESKSLLARMAVVLAGPIANLILATVIFAIVFMIGITQIKPIIGDVKPDSIASKAGLQSGDQIIQMGRWKTNDWQHVVMFLITHMGDKQEIPIVLLPRNTQTPITRTIHLQHWQFDPLKPDLLSSLGFTPYVPNIPPIIASILPDSPASKSDLRENDHILEINHSPVLSWQALVKWVEKHPNQSAIVTIRRNNILKRIPIQIGEKDKMGFLGIHPKSIKIPESMQIKEQYPWYLTGKPSVKLTEQWVIFHLVVIKQMLLGRISLKTLGGPVSIFQTAGMASLEGLTTYLQFIALISVVLGVLNLLPIPALDGGHFMFFVIEGVMRKSIPMRIQVLLINIGIILLLTMMVYATVNDLTRLLK